MTAVAQAATRTKPAYRPSQDFVAEVLAGDLLAIARMITRAETGIAEAGPALAEIYRHAGKAHVIGITGVPGAGKSTLVSALIKTLAADGHKVGVVAIDPSSPYSGGAILGDRVRMNDNAQAGNAFVRSMATRGHLGGLAPATLQAVDVLDAAGYSPIIIETVGVGQDEVEVVSAAHTVVVLSAPGLGDDVQAIKAGILEIADIHTVSKADKPEAAATLAALKAMMTLGGPAEQTSWTVPVFAVSPVTGDKVNKLKELIQQHWLHLNDTGELGSRQRKICMTRILGAARRLFHRRFVTGATEIEALLQSVLERRDDPETAARTLLSRREALK
ncbi:methylmalonyl Co-A mutase-associated GTPase MeaB [Brucella cytisi]|jgi:LAO/AO transport system kinase|uniref:LAO/AO ABC transporter ATP-binding protein n=1 Tax=Brucella cytisi TaxID=407152 RepID=A0A1J6IET7_9HYPH|nr:methylmalonyl Co-A mutase-associated GTPase MeaB [Brucella cytisi]OIS93600.1 LAO/AO ABC transporter ATP-binding protein [Brucella cytisi]